MRNNLRRLYNLLPSVRETRSHILPSLAQSTTVLNKILRIEQDRFVSELLLQEKSKGAKRLNAHEFKVYSQNGEDGIIAEILRRIGTKDKTFIEIGVDDGLETNTTFLLTQAWRGTWVEGSQQGASRIRNNFKKCLDNQQLRLIESMVTRENVLQILSPPEEVDILSIDIDLNTYYIWEALEKVRARVAIIEYNGIFPPWIDWKVEYHADQWWTVGTHHYGASLKALELLGRRMGYTLVGCDIRGVNAFFVRSELAKDLFHSPFTAEEHFLPLRTWLVGQNAYVASASEFS